LIGCGIVQAAQGGEWIRCFLVGSTSFDRGDHHPWFDVGIRDVLEVTSIAKLAITSIPEIETSFLAVCVAFTSTDITVGCFVGVD
jgi:hypothetical protein